MNTTVRKVETKRSSGAAKKRKATKHELKSQKMRKEMVVTLGFRDRSHPIASESLSKRWSRTEGHLKKVLSRLILEAGHKIGSCAAGFFAIKTAEDRETAARWLRQRAFKILLRCAVISEEHVEDVFRGAWEEYYESKRSRAIERNLEWPHKKASGNGLSR